MVCNKLTRRSFVKIAGVTVPVLLGNPTLLAGEDSEKPTVWIIEGKDKGALIDKAAEIIQKNGAFGKNAKTLALKVNAAWARKPKFGATTHPELVKRFLNKAKEFGITDLLVPENSCARPELAFKYSGLQDVVKSAGAKMINLKDEKKAWTSCKIDKGQSLTKINVAKDFLEADVVVNMPVAKDHGATELSIAMKNWMGAVKDRGYWHRNKLHQCISDFATFLQPQWTIVDATRLMLTRGPQGPSRSMKHPNKIIVSQNQVAADAVSSMLFDMLPEEIKYLRLAKKAGLGPISIKDINVVNARI